MASNKVACIHIAHKEIRIAEGRASDGVILVSRTTVIKKAARFFSGGRLVYLSDMVRTIINQMKMNSFTAKTVHIVYDNNVDVRMEVKDVSEHAPYVDVGREARMLLGKKAVDNGIIEHSKVWGRYITETEQGEMHSTVRIERDLVDFLVTEFHAAGYKVASLEVPETVLLYLRKIVPFSYDALNKIVVYANSLEENGKFFHFTKDAPSDTSTLYLDESDTRALPDIMVEVIEEEVQKKNFVNPHIILVGDLFAEKDTYLECCKLLQEHELTCIDTYSLWRDKSAPLNAVKVITVNEEQEVEINGKFGLCIALLARALEPKPENLVEGFHPMFVGRTTKKTLVDLALMLAASFAICGLVNLGVGAYEVITASTEFNRASAATEETLRLAEAERDAVKLQINALNTIDPRYNEIFHFVYSQLSENINIASVDTADLIPSDIDPSSKFDTPNPEDTGATDITVNQQAEYVMQTIVIRGYARTTDGPVELYNALVGAGLGEVKIVGVEQVVLPSGETLFAFELTVGTNEGGM